MALDVLTVSVPADTASATQTIAIGFPVKAAIFYATDLASDAESMTAGNGCLSIGFSDGSAHTCVVAAGDDAVATSNNARQWSENRCISIATDGTPTIANQATAAFSGNDIVLTWDSTPAAAYELGIMAFGGSDITNVDVGIDTMPTAAGNKSVTTVGFQGDIVFIVSDQRTSTGSTANIRTGYGWAVTAAKEFAASICADDAQTMGTGVNASSIVSGSSTIRSISNVTTQVNADFTQFTSNGFDLNFGTAPGTAYSFGWLVIKGGQWDASNAAKPATATTQSATGRAFQPKIVGFCVTAGTTGGTITQPARMGVGGATGTSAEVNVQFHHNDNINTVVETQASSTKCLGIGAVFADFTSFNSDGWTITWAQAGNAEIVGWWMAGDNAVAPAGFGPLLSTERNMLVMGN